MNKYVIYGFVKRAKEFGIKETDAIRILKESANLPIIQGAMKPIFKLPKLDYGKMNPPTFNPIPTNKI